MHGFKLCKFNLIQLHQNVIHIEVGCKESGYNLIRSEDANYIKQFEIVKEDIICTENCNNLYDFKKLVQTFCELQTIPELILRMCVQETVCLKLLPAFKCK